MGILLKSKPTKPPKRTGMSVREYMALSPDPHCETLLLYGKVIEKPKPRPKHNDLLNDLGTMLKRWIRHMKLGRMFLDCDLILSEADELVYAPDLMFLATEHLDRCKDEMVYGPVDLAIEILSPSERPYLQKRKFSDYEHYGISWYWIINPDTEQPTLEEHQLIDGRYECRNEITGEEWFEPGLFPGLTFRLPQLLAGDLKAAVKGKSKKLM